MVQGQGYVIRESALLLLQIPRALCCNITLLLDADFVKKILLLFNITLLCHFNSIPKQRHPIVCNLCFYKHLQSFFPYSLSRKIYSRFLLSKFNFKD